MGNKSSISMNVFDQLMNKAQENDEHVDELVARYIQERFIYRLSVSSYQDQFWVGGDILLVALTNGFIKQPQEISLTAKPIAQKISMMKHAFQEICGIELLEDGVVFLGSEIEISLEKEMIHLKIPATLSHITTYIIVTIRFTEIIPLAPKTIVFPPLLDMASPVLVTASPEFALAQKFVEMYQYPTLETTIKAFNDVFALLKTQKIEGRVLQQCIIEIFDCQRLILERNHPLFMKQLADQTVAFVDVIKQVQRFFRPVYEVLLNEDEFFKQWDCAYQIWQ